MTTVHYDQKCSDDQRRELIYSGDVFVYSPSKHALAMVDLARDMLAKAFGSRDPQTAQFDMAVEQFAALLADLKPRFIHHPQCKRLLPALLRDLGCDPEQTYFDVPRMRSSTSDDYLTTGIAYAFHPHRDTWYSAPMCQINFWFPIFPITARNCMAFHPRYFSNGVRNSSDGYNYQEWNRTSRYQAAQQIGVDTRTQPKSLEQVELQPDLRLVSPPGGIIIFSAAQLHSSVPNDSGRTRYSIDFRTVHAGDARALRGASNVDSYCTGSTMGDYLRCTDLAHLPPEVMALYDAGPPKPAARL
jgi:hypothetical protein